MNSARAARQPGPILRRVICTTKLRWISRDTSARSTPAVPRTSGARRPVPTAEAGIPQQGGKHRTMTFLIDDFGLSRDLAKGRTPGKAIGNFPKCQLHCLCGFGHGAGLAQFREVQFCAQTICLENSLSDLRAEGPYTVLAGEQSAD